MLPILKNKYHVLNERSAEFKFDYEKEKLTSSNDNEQEDAILETCI